MPILIARYRCDRCGKTDDLEYLSEPPEKPPTWTTNSLGPIASRLVCDECAAEYETWWSSPGRASFPPELRAWHEAGEPRCEFCGDPVNMIHTPSFCEPDVWVPGDCDRQHARRAEQ